MIVDISLITTDTLYNVSTLNLCLNSQLLKEQIMFYVH